MVRERIFGHLMDISSFDQANLVLSLLKYWKPFTEEEKTLYLKHTKKITRLTRQAQQFHSLKNWNMTVKTCYYTYEVRPCLVYLRKAYATRTMGKWC
ncbi:MAG TPA: hypothetical protein HA269_07710 [Ferroplasma sp.]|nr:hypothetical protein [Ferroplasma sp.]